MITQRGWEIQILSLNIIYFNDSSILSLNSEHIFWAHNLRSSKTVVSRHSNSPYNALFCGLLRTYNRSLSVLPWHTNKTRFIQNLLPDMPRYGQFRHRFADRIFRPEIYIKFAKTAKHRKSPHMYAFKSSQNVVGLTTHLLTFPLDMDHRLSELRPD